MNDNHWLMLLILVILVLLLANSWFIAPYSDQERMIDYDNQHLNVTTGFYSDVKCPYGHGDNIKHIDSVHQKIVDHRVDGKRIKLVQIYYCEIHHTQFSVVLHE